MTTLRTKNTFDLFDALFSGLEPNLGAHLRSKNHGFSPALELEEDESAYYLFVEVPGIAQKDLDIQLREKKLVIKGEKTRVAKEGETGRYFSERSYGSFERVVSLPRNVDPKTVSASLENGVLSVRVEKREPESESTSIPITLGGQ